MAIKLKLNLDFENIWKVIAEVLPSQKLIKKEDFLLNFEYKLEYIIFSDNYVYSNTKNEFVNEIGIRPINLIPDDPFGPVFGSTKQGRDSFGIGIFDRTGDKLYLKDTESMLFFFFPILELNEVFNKRYNWLEKILYSDLRRKKRVEKILENQLGLINLDSEVFYSSPVYSKRFHFNNEYSEFLLEEISPKEEFSLIAKDLNNIFELLNQK